MWTYKFQFVSIRSLLLYKRKWNRYHDNGKKSNTFTRHDSEAVQLTLCVESGISSLNICYQHLQYKSILLDAQISRGTETYEDRSCGDLALVCWTRFKLHLGIFHYELVHGVDAVRMSRPNVYDGPLKFNCLSQENVSFKPINVYHYWLFYV